MRIPALFLAASLLSLAEGARAQSPDEATATAPATFQVKLETTKGAIVMDCHRDWAPNGIDRFYNLVRLGFFTDMGIFRVAPGFVAQWGIHGDPAISKKWQNANIKPDPVKESNKRGRVTYAMAGSPDTRSTQLFINYRDNTNLDKMGFAPICEVTTGMEVADKLYSGYGEKVTSKQGEIGQKGNAYLRETWPELDYIQSAAVVGENAVTPKPSAPESSAPTSTWWYIGGAAALAVIALLLFRKREEPAAPRPAPASDGEEPRVKRNKRRKGKRKPRASE